MEESEEERKLRKKKNEDDDYVVRRLQGMISPRFTADSADTLVTDDFEDRDDDEYVDSSSSSDLEEDNLWKNKHVVRVFMS